MRKLISNGWLQSQTQCNCRAVRWPSHNATIWLSAFIILNVATRTGAAQTEPIAQMSDTPDRALYCAGDREDSVLELWLAEHPQFRDHGIASSDDIDEEPILLSRSGRFMQRVETGGDQWVAYIVLVAVIDTTGSVAFAEPESTHTALISRGPQGERPLSQADAEIVLRRFQMNSVHYMEAFKFRPASMNNQPVAALVCQPLDMGYTRAGLRPPNK